MNNYSTGPAPREAARSFSPYVPGLSIDEIRERYGLGRVIKLASNENPLGVSPRVQAVLEKNLGLAFRYPQSGVPKLTAAIAAHHGLSASRVAVGNGSDEIIDLLVRVLAEPGKHNIVAFDPCFSIYRLQAKLAGVEFRQTRLNPDFSFPWQKYLDLVDENTKIAFITCPDNPSGYCPPVAELEALLNALPASCLLLVDEAYLDFCDDEAAYSLLPRLEQFSNLAVLRTFSKSFGLAGLRVGYGLLPEYLADILMRVHLPFSVNVLAEQAALEALKDREFYQRTLSTVRTGRRELAAALDKLGFETFPSQANFIMTRPPDKITASDLFELLLQKGFIVRPLKSYGLPEHLRVSIGTPEENMLFIHACEEILR